ncbi:MAG TPA: hypothetical protein VFJ74_13585, partial [Gemmatimonadaceae bacterium]|nr:hypothetical protein [Gemmatimonadaceae bacterium]
MTTTFRDGDGIEWTVTEIAASALAALPRASLRHPEFKDGWLLFQSNATRKRLAPYPKEWQALSAEELSQLCQEARPELATRTPTGEMRAFGNDHQSSSPSSSPSAAPSAAPATARATE